MKLLLVTSIVVAAIAVNICDTNALLEGQFIEMCVNMGQLSTGFAFRFEHRK